MDKTTNTHTAICTINSWDYYFFTQWNQQFEKLSVELFDENCWKLLKLSIDNNCWSIQFVDSYENLENSENFLFSLSADTLHTHSNVGKLREWNTEKRKSRERERTFLRK